METFVLEQLQGPDAKPLVSNIFHYIRNGTVQSSSLSKDGQLQVQAFDVPLKSYFTKSLLHPFKNIDVLNTFHRQVRLLGCFVVDQRLYKNPIFYFCAGYLPSASNPPASTRV